MSFALMVPLLLAMLLLVVAGFAWSAWRVQQRQKRQLWLSTAISSFVLTLPASWYTRWRVLVSLAFLTMALLALCMQGGLAGETLHSLTSGLGLNILAYSQASDVQTVSQPMPMTASTRLLRLDSAARSQYYTDYQWQVWSYSSCSGMAMAEVMNAYGRHLIGADVLQEELKLGVWNIQLGLLREDGIAMTANYYGFQASLSHTRTLQDLIDLSNQGEPIIVGIRDSRYFPGGHLLVVRGGDSQYIYLADSSPANFQRMALSMFQGMWQGFSAVLTPQ